MGGPLEGILVSVTGVSFREENWIRRNVESLGGQFSENLNEETSCLIAKKVGSEKYRAAHAQLKTPVVVMQWLRDCRSTGKLMSYEDYSVPPFLGFDICCTQLSLEERHKLERKLVEHGAIFSSNLVADKCTHLVALEAEGDKYTAAKAWGNVHIVSMEWVDECLRKKRCVPEQSYLVLPRVHSKSRTTATTISRDQTRARLSLSQLQGGVCEREQLKRSSDKDLDVVICHPPDLRWEKLPLVEHVSAARSEIFKNDIFFISGFNSEQTDYLIQMIHAGGGRRHFVLTMSVTKVFLGPEANEKLIIEVCKHPCGAKCVLVEWLVETLVPDFDVSDNDKMYGLDEKMTKPLNEDGSSLDRFEHEITITDTKGSGITNAGSSRSQRREFLANATVKASSTGLKRTASEVAKDKDSNHISIRRRHSSNKNLASESQHIDWNNE